MPCRSLASFFTWRKFSGSGAITSSIARWTSTGLCWRRPRPKESFTSDTSDHAWFARAFQEISFAVSGSPGRSPPLNRAAGTRIYTLALFLPVLFYSIAMQGALLIEGARVEKYENAMCIALDEENAGWLLAAPGMSMLTAVADDLHRQGLRATVGIRSAEHRELAARRIGVVAAL